MCAGSPIITCPIIRSVNSAFRWRTAAVKVTAPEFACGRVICTDADRGWSNYRAITLADYHTLLMRIAARTKARPGKRFRRYCGTAASHLKHVACRAANGNSNESIIKSTYRVYVDRLGPTCVRCCSNRHDMLFKS